MRVLVGASNRVAHLARVQDLAERQREEPQRGRRGPLGAKLRHEIGVDLIAGQRRRLSHEGVAALKANGDLAITEDKQGHDRFDHAGLRWEGDFT